MAFKPKSKKSTGKAKKSNWGRKKNSGYKTTNIINRSLNPIPQRYICKMKYSDVYTQSFSLGQASLYQFRLNSIHDPDYTSTLTGHQPYGHDTFVFLYNRYRVIGCSYRIVAVPETGTTPIQVITIPTNDILTTTNLSALRELPRAKYVCVQQGDLKTLSGYVSCPSVAGRTKSQYIADDRYSAQMGANPLEDIMLNIYLGHLAGTVGTSVSCSVNIELEYTVEMFDIKTLAQS